GCAQEPVALGKDVEQAGAHRRLSQLLFPLLAVALAALLTLAATFLARHPPPGSARTCARTAAPAELPAVLAAVGRPSRRLVSVGVGATAALPVSCFLGFRRPLGVRGRPGGALSC